MSNARTRCGGLYASADHSWRDLSRGETLHGFNAEAVQLDIVLNQAAGSSSEDELQLTCPYPDCQ